MPTIPPTDPPGHCPACQAPPGAVIWAGGSPPYGPDHWQCEACGHQWQTPPARGPFDGIPNARDEDNRPLTPRDAHEAALAGVCSHGGHGWDGDTCSDITAAGCPVCAASTDIDSDDFAGHTAAELARWHS
jgi:hypothetical protein